MKVLMLQAPTFNPEMEGPIFPLGIAYLSRALRPKHEVRILDMNVLPGGVEDLLREVEAFRPEVLGYSMRNIKVGRPGVEEQLVSLDPLREPLRRVREAYPGIPIVAGGCAFGLYSDVFMARMPMIDMGVIGEGEQAFPALLEHLDEPQVVPGVVYRDDGEVRGEESVGGRPDFPALDSPDRAGIELSDYTDREYAIGVQAKRGCALRCLHCSDLYLTGGQVRRREPAQIVDEIEALVRDEGVTSFQFVDQVFNLPESHAEAICDEMVRRGLRVRWTAWFTAHGVSERFLRTAQRSGLTSLQFSPDSTSDPVLRTLRKAERRDDLVDACRTAKRVGIPVSFSFFYPNPGETFRSSIELFVFLARMKLELGNLLWLHGRMIVRTRVYPHSELHEMMVRQGLLDADHDLVAPVYWEPEPFRTVEQGIQGVFRRIYDTRLTLKRLGLAKERR